MQSRLKRYRIVKVLYKTGDSHENISYPAPDTAGGGKRRRAAHRARHGADRFMRRLPTSSCCRSSGTSACLSYRTIWNFAEEKDGPLMRRISEKAKQLNAFIHCGSFAEKCGDKLYNSCILFDRKGTDLAVYHKIHLFSCYGHEADTFTHGDKAVVVDTEEFGRGRPLDMLRHTLPGALPPHDRGPRRGGIHRADRVALTRARTPSRCAPACARSKTPRTSSSATSRDSTSTCACSATAR